MAQERREQLQEAARAYKRAVAVHQAVRGGATPPPIDELERWTETALYRQALLALRLHGAAGGAPALRAYRVHESQWPDTFRTPQRQVLRAWHADVPAKPAAGRAAAAAAPDAAGARTVSARRPRAVTQAHDYRAVRASAAQLLQQSSFPHADQSNAAAEQLAEQLVAAWRHGGGSADDGSADDVVDVLYELMRFTFRSQPIQRLLVHMLAAAEAYAEAIAVLERYMRVVESAWTAHGVPARTVLHGARAVDGAAEFVDTLLLGAHVQLVYMRAPGAAAALTDRLLALVGESAVGDAAAASGTTKALRAAVDAPTLARILRTSGAALHAAVPGASPSRRGAVLADARARLERAAVLDDDASETHFALACAAASERDVPAALAAARRALELEPAHVDAWHLIVLLLSAQKDFGAALSLADEAVAQADADDSADIPSGAAPPTALLSFDFPPSRFARAAAYVRLLLTHIALVEMVDGSKAALDAQPDLFAAYQSRVAPLLGGGAAGAEAPRAALDAADAFAPCFTPDAAPALAAAPAAARAAFRRAEGTALLQALWLQSAAAFRRAGNLAQSRYAIAEAEALDARAADVWVQLAQWCLAADYRPGAAVSCLYKALACSADHVAASVHLARVLLEPGELHLRGSHAASIAAVATAAHGAEELTRLSLVDDADGGPAHSEMEERARASPSVDIGVADGRRGLAPVDPAFAWRDDPALSNLSLAEALLRTATLYRGWDVPEAWHLLALQAQKAQRPLSVQRAALLEALRLEQTRPVRPLAVALRW